MLSTDIKIIGSVKKFLAGTEFNLRVINKPGGSIPMLNDIKLLILDLGAEKEGSNTDTINAFREIERKYNIAKIALLNPGQEHLLLESEIRSDDFCFYPQIERELILRIKAVLLRMSTYTPRNSIIVKGLVLNLDKYELSVNGTPIELTFKEFELLKLLLKNQNKVFTRKKLLSIIWEYDFYGGSRTIDVHIRRLRSKIPTPYNLMLKTVRNVGYMFSSYPYGFGDS